MEDEGHLEEQVMEEVTPRSTNDSTRIFETSSSQSLNSSSATTEIIQKIKQLEKMLKRDYMKNDANSPEHEECLSLLRQCQNLATTRNSKSVISKMLQNLETYMNPDMKKHARRILEIALKIDQTNQNSHPRQSATDPSLNIKPEDIHRARRTCRVKVNKHCSSADFSLFDRNKKQEFFSLCLSIKLKLKSRNSAHMISIIDLYNEAVALGIKQEHWPGFINLKFNI